MQEIKVNFTKILREAQANNENFESKLIEAMEYIGDEQVEKNRNEGNYQDRTGNLRHSNYYVVKNKGKEVSSATDDSTGQAQKAMQHKGKTGRIELVVGAGMEYASAVQLLKGYTVLVPMTKDEFENKMGTLL